MLSSGGGADGRGVHLLHKTGDREMYSHDSISLTNTAQIPPEQSDQLHKYLIVLDTRVYVCHHNTNIPQLKHYASSCLSR